MKSKCLTGAVLYIATGGFNAALATDYSLRFFGNGVSTPGLDRVTIDLDDPHRPVDVGIGDFTIEWWMKANLAENSSDACFTGRDNWIYGNILLDRDIWGAGDWGDWGVSIRGGVVAFGIDINFIGVGICGATTVADGQWHHVAVARRASDGRLQVYVDGNLDGQSLTGPTGDASYRDGRPTSYTWDPYLVIGAEKHDVGAEFPSFSGWVDELRVSTILRYESNFTPPTAPFVADTSTAALYHFDEGSGSAIVDSSGTSGGPSDGVLRYGGDPAGPIWTTDTPVSSVVFRDGFEDGSAAAWSKTVG